MEALLSYNLTGKKYWYYHLTALFHTVLNLVAMSVIQNQKWQSNVRTSQAVFL